MEKRCLQGVREKCSDCDGPECAYAPKSQCEEDNLAYLAPDVRAELEAYRAAMPLERAQAFAQADRDGRPGGAVRVQGRDPTYHP